MSKAVKAAGLGLVIFVTVWVVTLWQWYRSQQPVSSEEVATQLILLPVGLTVVALLAWWGARRLHNWSSRPLEPVPKPSLVNAGTGALTGGDKAPDAAPLGLVSILAEALALPDGDDPELAWSALRSGQVRPRLDPDLQDADGMPVFSSRVPDLSTQDWLDAHAEVTDNSLPQALLRAMALVEAPLHRLLSALPVGELGDGEDDAVEASAPGPAFLSGVGQSGAQEQAARRRELAPALDIQVWVPAEWPEDHRKLFVGWLRQQTGVALDWSRASNAGEPRWSVEPLDTPEAGWDRLLPRLNELHADTRPRLLLVLVAHSLVDEAGVTGLQARGELFTSLHQGGRVPGEGSAGLLLANARMAARCAQAGHPWLGVPRSTHRQRSADRGGRPGSEELVTAMQQVLAPWSQSPQSPQSPEKRPESQVGQGGWWCLSDADHRPSRTSELFEAFQALQPDGDAMQSVLRLGDAWGDMGIARALLPVALAASVVRQGLQPADAAEPHPVPALIGLLQGSHRRWAIPVWPASVGREALARLTPPRASLPASTPAAMAPVAEPLAA